MRSESHSPLPLSKQLSSLSLILTPCEWLKDSGQGCYIHFVVSAGHSWGCCFAFFRSDWSQFAVSSPAAPPFDPLNCTT